MIEIKNISFKYRNGNQILDNINLKVDNGEILSIIGNNGAGKSTLLKIISGILKPNKGSIIIDDLDAYLRHRTLLAFVHIMIFGQNTERF